MDNYQEKRDNAVNTSLCFVAESLGFTPERVANGLMTLKEHDSVRIYNDKTYTRFSDHTGGSTIDFVMNFTDRSFNDAVDYINGLNGSSSYIDLQQKYSSYKEEYKKKEPVDFVLPEKNSDYRHTYAYLTKNRGLSRDTIDLFIHEKILYEDKEHHNMVFVGYDDNNEPKFAFKRGTYDADGKKYKRDVPGSMKEYGVCLKGRGTTVFVFEAPIDMMSYIDLWGKTEASYLSLDGLADAALQHFLDSNKNIKKICFCLDSDEPGQDACEKLSQKFFAEGYECVSDVPSGKDWNEELLTVNQQNLKGRKI